MMELRTWVCLTVFLVAFHGVSSLSKYDERANKQLESEFRMSRINALWKKAKKMIHGEGKLKNLKLELRKLDKLELELKHMKEDGKDKDGVVEGEVRNRLLDILERYGLVPNESSDNIIEHHAVKKKFSDERLKNLWQQAMYHSSFSPEELVKLQEELNHHEDKVVQYNALSEELDRHEAISDNHVESFEKPSKEELKRMRLSLKENFHDVSNGISEIKKKIQRRLDDNPQDFQDSRILDLWRKAKTNNFNKEELESIREELVHFQNRIHKHDYWTEQRDILKTGAVDGDEQMAKKHNEAQKRIDEHGRYIKKYHATMIDRVNKRDEF